MAITVGAHTSASGQNTFSTGTIDTTGASLLVINLAYQQGSSPVISDTIGGNSNTWTALAEQLQSGSTANRMFYAQNPTVGAGHTFTATGSNIFAALSACAVNGTLIASVIDQQAGADGLGTVTTLKPGSVTPGANNEIVFSGVGAGLVSVSLSIDSGFTVTDQAGPSGFNYTGSLAYKIQTTAAAVDPEWTSDGAPSYMAGTNATFKVSSAVALTKSVFDDINDSPLFITGGG